MILEEIVRDKSNKIQHKTETLESVIMEEICHNEEVRNTTKTLSITDDEECCFASARAVNDEMICLDGERRKRNGVVERKEIRMISKRKKPSKLSLTRQKLAERAEKLQKEKELEAAKIEGDNNDEDMDDDNDQDADSDGKEAKTRAMDTFVSKPTKNKRQDENNAPHHANKRKKLVEKTFMNDKGYLVTEMVTEWVDVTHDDMQKTKQQETKRQEKKTIHKKKVKSSAGKNQSTMMGFFSVKKWCFITAAFMVPRCIYIDPRFNFISPFWKFSVYNDRRIN